MSEAALRTETRHDEAMAAARRAGVVWRAYAGAARHLFRLVVPSLLMFVPMGVLSLAGLATVTDESAAQVNGEFQLLGEPGWPLLVWTLVALLASLAGQAVVVPATVVLAAGLLTGRPVTTSAAMRATMRRWSPLLSLTLLGALVFVVIAAAGLGMLLWIEHLLGAFLVMVPLALLAMPCLLAVAIVVLEGASAGSALHRAYRLLRAVGPTNGGLWSGAFTLAFGVLILPAAAQQAVLWGASGNPLAHGVATSVLGLATPAFQGTVIARLLLHRLAIRRLVTEFGQIVERLPECGASPLRPVRVVGALLLPGLLYGGTMLVNPFGWLEVTQTVVTASWSREGASEPQPDGRPKPTVSGWDLQAIHAGEGGRMVMLMDSFAQAKLLTCTDSTCAGTRYAWAEPVGAAETPRAPAARLVGGRLVVATWAQTEDRIVAMTQHPYGGLMLAQVRPLPGQDGEMLSVTRCDDPACTSPRTKDVAKLPFSTSSYQDRGLVIGVAPVADPVVLRFDEDTGAISVITCEDHECARMRVEQPVKGGETWRHEEYRDRSGATMAIRYDGRPVIAYRDSADGSIRLLDCRNQACSQADTAVLSAPGQDHLAPALVLDASERALVAYQDLDREQLVVAACTGTRCTHTPVAKMRNSPGFGLAMTLDGRGRPVIAWMDGSPYYDDWHLVVTVPHSIP
ncbi:hypothetical protein E1286_21800 [Nonomuraea terrae]|uniref:Uncharacterized protein n=1 Tax=Nonomuraea terrae TaxID=2530383 RepID=A0A4R4YM95_9ACTN|nr:hypothetical protein [Nonomuraea terrae]TDD46131.1 hypothetical protein E1286_21800 [Nonomuraea terrae]